MTKNQIMFTNEEKRVIGECRKVGEIVIEKMNKMNRRERDEYWRGLSDTEKQAFVVAMLTWSDRVDESNEERYCQECDHTEHDMSKELCPNGHLMTYSKYDK